MSPHLNTLFIYSMYRQERKCYNILTFVKLKFGLSAHFHSCIKLIIMTIVNLEHNTCKDSSRHLWACCWYKTTTTKGLWVVVTMQNKKSYVVFILHCVEWEKLL